MDKSTKKFLNKEQATKKLEHYCAYQERCHFEVSSKLYTLGVSREYHDEIIVHLIGENFLNEERFARSFARGKHLIKHWGKMRIVSELKFKKLSPYNIKKALEEISDDLYFETLDRISLNKWNTTTANSTNAKRNKVISFLMRKGYESEYIYERINYLGKNDKEE